MSDLSGGPQWNWWCSKGPGPEGCCVEAEQEVLRAAWLKSSASGILVRRNILGVHAYASGKREKPLLYFLNKQDYPRTDKEAKRQGTGGKQHGDASICCNTFSVT